MNATSAVETLAALAHASRLAVFRLLVQHAPDGLHPSELTAALDIAPTLLSFHLKGLSHAGLVTTEQNGRFVRYRANVDRVQALTAYLLEHCCLATGQSCAPACAVPEAATGPTPDPSL